MSECRAKWLERKGSRVSVHCRWTDYCATPTIYLAYLDGVNLYLSTDLFSGNKVCPIAVIPWKNLAAFFQGITAAWTNSGLTLTIWLFKFFANKSGINPARVVSIQYWYRLRFSLINEFYTTHFFFICTIYSKFEDESISIGCAALKLIATGVSSTGHYGLAYEWMLCALLVKIRHTLPNMHVSWRANSFHATFVWSRNTRADMQHHHMSKMHSFHQSRVIKMGRQVCTV